MSKVTVIVNDSDVLTVNFELKGVVLQVSALKKLGQWMGSKVSGDSFTGQQYTDAVNFCRRKYKIKF